MREFLRLGVCEGWEWDERELEVGLNTWGVGM